MKKMFLVLMIVSGIVSISQAQVRNLKGKDLVAGDVPAVSTDNRFVASGVKATNVATKVEVAVVNAKVVVLENIKPFVDTNAVTVTTNYVPVRVGQQLFGKVHASTNAMWAAFDTTTNGWNLIWKTPAAE